MSGWCHYAHTMLMLCLYVCVFLCGFMYNGEDRGDGDSDEEEEEELVTDPKKHHSDEVSLITFCLSHLLSLFLSVCPFHSHFERVHWGSLTLFCYILQGTAYSEVNATEEMSTLVNYIEPVKFKCFEVATSEYGRLCVCERLCDCAGVCMCTSKCACAQVRVRV